MRASFAVLAVVCGLSAGPPSVAVAQTLDRLGLTGYYEFYAGHLAEPPLDFLSGWNRLRLNLTADHPTGRIEVSGRLTQSFVDPQDGGSFTPPKIRLWEGFVDIYTSRVDIRLGQQLIVWGQADGAFITDIVSPLDLSQYLAQDFTDIRLPIPAATATYYVDNFAWTAIVTLVPTESILPTTESPWFVVPDLPPSIGVDLADSNLPGFGLKNMEPGSRLTYSGIDRTEISLIYLYGFNRIPAFGARLSASSPTEIAADIVPTYYRRHVAGVRWSTALTDPWVLDSEMAFESRFDVETNELLIEEAFADENFLSSTQHLHGMMGVERTIGETFGRLQFIGSYLTQYNDSVLRDRFIPSVTGYLRSSFQRETLAASIFAFYNLGRDAWLNPAVQWSPGGGFNMFVGAHIFIGTDDVSGISTSTFTLYDQNDHLYVRVTQHF